KARTRVNMFVDKDTELVKESSKKAEAKIALESSSKRARKELEQDVAKKQKIDDDQEESEMKKLIKVVPDEEEVAIDVIPLATKPPSIINWKIVKEGKISLFQIIRANGSSKSAAVTLVDETQKMNDDNLMFDTHMLEEQEKKVDEKEVSAADPVTTGGEVFTTANVEVTTVDALTTTIDELTLAQALIEIKAAKPKAVTSAATTTTTIRPKARGVVVIELSEFKTTSSPLQASQLSLAKDKGKEKMVEPEKPLKKKEKIAMDEEVAS
ncbi:hypothetical protein Tco_0787175, partial [Tanacetum coccineum]